MYLQIISKGSSHSALIIAVQKNFQEIVKILVEQEGIDINAKNKVYFNNFLFQNNIWNFIKLFETALIWASFNGHTEIVKILVEQEGIDNYPKNIGTFVFQMLQILLACVMSFRCKHKCCFK